MGIESPKPRTTLDWQSLHAELQSLVVGGHHAKCREILEQYHPQKIPRMWAYPLADLAVRAHFPLFALKALHSSVLQGNAFGAPATHQERMTYARALYHLGAVEDSIEILQSVDAKREPDVLFLRACASIFNWNYLAAIPDLKMYLRSKEVAPYRRVVAKVNLAAAYVNIGAWTEAEIWLTEIQNECEAQSYTLLLGNTLELRSQVELFQGRFASALSFLEKAQVLLEKQGALYSLYVEKWQAVCHCLQAPTIENLLRLKAVRKKALEVGHWSTIRECDLFCAIATQDEQIIRKVIMGTPSEFYRQRARKLFKTDLVFRGQYKWKIKGDVAVDHAMTFNPYRKIPGRRVALYEKPMLLSLFEALAGDFYQPSHISLLFKKIYPAEKFNPFSSPARVLQLLRRLDHWFKDNEIPLRVRFKKSEFCLRSIGDVFVIVQRGKDLAQQSSKYRQLADLRLLLKNKSLSVEKICRHLDISESSARRLLKQGLLAGQIKKMGVGRSTVYLAGSTRQKSEAV